MKTIEKIRTKVDWPTTLIPFVIVLALMIVFMLIPEQSKVERHPALSRVGRFGAKEGAELRPGKFQQGQRFGGELVAEVGLQRVVAREIP